MIIASITYGQSVTGPKGIQASGSWQSSPPPLPPNIRLSTKRVVPNTATVGDVLTYTVVVDKRGGPNQNLSMMIDRLKPEVAFTGSLTYTGLADQFFYTPYDHAIGWFTVLPDGPMTTILTWQVEITGVPAGGVLTNSALIASDNHWVTREAAVIIHTPTASVTPTPTDTSTPTNTPTPTDTPTHTPTNTPLPTATAKPASPDTSPAGTAQNPEATPTATPTATPVSTPTPTVSATPQIIPSSVTTTPSPTAMPTATSPVPTQTATPVERVVSSSTPTPKTSEVAGQVRQSGITTQNPTPAPTPSLSTNSPGIRAYGISLASCLLCGIIVLLILAIIVFIAQKTLRFKT